MIDSAAEARVTPVGILERLSSEVRELAASMPSKGFRQETMLDVANRSARTCALTNHELLVLLEYLADQYGIFPASNLYKRWAGLLSMLRNVRKHTPNPAHCDQGKAAPDRPIP